MIDTEKKARQAAHDKKRAADPARLAARRAVSKKYYASVKSSETHVASRHACTELWREANKEHLSASKRAWVEANAEKIAAYNAANVGAKNATTARRRARKLQATPAWADRTAIRGIYEAAAMLGMQVDHIIPLNHHLVSGLHVPANLQLLTASENYRKSNKFAQEAF